MNAPAIERLVLFVQDGAVLRLTLNRGSARNALSEGLMAALQDALDVAAADKALRVIVIAADGPAFCAGHDLKEMTAHRKNADGGKAAFGALFAQCSRLKQTIVRHPLPVIAQVQGVATAAGCQLVASCDLAVAVEDASFSTPGGRGGWFCHTPMVAVARAIGPRRALELGMTGDSIDARTALAWGLVNRVVPRAQLVAEAEKLARAASRGSRASKALGKQTFYRQVELGLEAAYAEAVEVMAHSALTPDGREAMRAFIEKRPAVYSPDR